jgi:rod shape-determining protein MreC
VALSGRPDGRSPRRTLVILTLVSLTVVALDTFGFGPLESLRNGVSTVFSPVTAVGDAVFGPIGDVWDATVNRADLRAENEELREENAQLRDEAATTEQAQALLDQLAGATNIVLPQDIPRVTAQISSNPVSNFDQDYEIDQGASSGVAPGMPIVIGGDQGTTLVGVVTEVSLVSAKVELITDTDMQVGVRIAPSNDIGVMRGQGEGQPMLIDTGIERRSDVEEGNVVSTAGVVGSLFPPLLNVGLVIEGRDAPNPLLQEVLVQPPEGIESLSFVSVLRVDCELEAATAPEPGCPTPEEQEG